MSGLGLNSWAWWTISAGLGLALAVAIAVSPPLGQSARDGGSTVDYSNPLGPAYVGDAACARCHPAEAEWHRHSGHAHTLQGDTLCDRFPQLLDRDFPDPERSGRFRFECVDGRLVAESLKDGARRRLPVQFALGSGKHAVTFVTLIDDPGGTPAAVEHRLSLLGKEVGVTPGQGGAPVEQELDCLGRVKRGRDVVRCIECHSTTGQVRGTEVLDLRANVSCERCHGPGRPHLAAVERGLSDLAIPFAPRSASADDEVQLCGQCHRLPEAMATIPDPEDKKLARFQPIGLQQSACFRRSNGELRCSTCHNPHQPVSHDATVYNQQCSNCHSTVETTCSWQPSGDCIRCHLPEVEVHPGISFHDHWVRRDNALRNLNHPKSAGGD